METGQSKHRLLLVDGDPKSLRVLEVSLKKAGFEVVTATQGSEALSALQAAPLDLIIADTDLDGMDGFDLCRQIKAKPEWAKIPFLFVSGRKSIEDKIRGLELGVEDYLTKPIYIKEIGIRVRTALQRAERERLESRREGRTKFTGDLADIGVVDLVQTIDLNRKSGIIHIVNRDGRRGAVFFREGRVIDAEVGRLSGAEAMYRLFSWSDGRFEVDFKPIRRADVIDLPSAALLMEGMRRLDEWTRLLEKLPALDSAVEVDFRVLADQLADLPDEMNGILRLCDGNRSLLAVIDDSDYPDLEALTVASKLLDQGIIYAREPPGLRSEAEPGGELARWLAEGNAEEAALGEEASAAPRSVAQAETGRFTDTLTGERRLFTHDVQESGERQAGKTHRAFSLHAPPFSVDTPLPTRGGLEESIERDNRAGNTLRLTPTFPDQDAAPSRPARALPLSPTGDATADLGSPREASSVVEDSWREPVQPAIGLSRMGGAGATPAAVVKTAADKAGVGAKPDTLRGIPIPEAIAEEDPGGPDRPSVASDADRPARTTIEFIARRGAVAPVESAGPTAASVAAPVGEGAAATEVGRLGPGNWEQAGVRKVRRDKSQCLAAEARRQSDSIPGRHFARQPPPFAPELGQSPRRSDQPPQVEQAVSERPTVERTLVITEDQRPNAGLSLDKLDSDLLPHERRWPLFAVAGCFARRRWPVRLADQLEPGAERLLDRRPQPPRPQAISSPVEAGQGVDNRGSAESVDQETRLAAAGRAGRCRETGRSHGGCAGRAGRARPGRNQEVNLGSHLVGRRTGRLTAASPPPATLGAPGTPGPGERCRKADAGGKGRPTAVLAACRPAIEAEPEAADIMVILARAELERGRAVEARSWAKKALAAKPDLADAYVFLGGAEQEVGNPDAAKAAYKKYLDLAPSGRHARELRAVLDSM
jgi:CheY-like chemotaxis protein